MNQLIKEIRTYQIAALAIMNNLQGCKVEEVSSPYYDFIVTVEESSLVFGVEVKNSGFLRTNHYHDYLESLTEIDVSERQNRIPILIAAVNEEDESVKMGFLLAWQFGKARLFKKPSMVELNKANADKILDFIKSMDETIRILSMHGMKVVKKIRVEYQHEDGHLSHGNVVYLRDFTSEYKMHQKEIVDEREQLERMIHGTPQNEYPDDELDRVIFDLILERFPKSTKISNLLLFSTELRDLQMLSQSNIRRLEFIITPDTIGATPMVMAMLNGVETVNFGVDIFIDAPWDVKVFENQFFEKGVAIDGWFNTYSSFKQMIATLSSPKEFFIEG